MAKNWSMRQAAEAVLAGNKEDIIDIGRRFPLTLNALSSMNGNKGAMDIISALPEHITARKIEAGLKDGVAESVEDEIEEPKELEVSEPEEKPVKDKKARRTKKADEDSLETMSEVELFKLCKSRGIKAKPKQNKEYYLDLLKESEDDAKEVEEKPAKKAASKKETKAAAKKKEVPMNPPEDDEDTEEDEDDWDI